MPKHDTLGTISFAEYNTFSSCAAACIEKPCSISCTSMVATFNTHKFPAFEFAPRVVARRQLAAYRQRRPLVSLLTTLRRGAASTAAANAGGARTEHSPRVRALPLLQVVEDMLLWDAELARDVKARSSRKNRRRSALGSGVQAVNRLRP